MLKRPITFVWCILFSNDNVITNFPEFSFSYSLPPPIQVPPSPPSTPPRGWLTREILSYICRLVEGKAHCAGALTRRKLANIGRRRWGSHTAGVTPGENSPSLLPYVKSSNSQEVVSLFIIVNPNFSRTSCITLLPYVLNLPLQVLYSLQLYTPSGLKFLCGTHDNIALYPKHSTNLSLFVKIVRQ